MSILIGVLAFLAVLALFAVMLLVPMLLVVKDIRDHGGSQEEQDQALRAMSEALFEARTWWPL